MKNVGIIYGGDSAEAVVSVESAKTVKTHLEKEGFTCRLVQIKKGDWHVVDNGNKISIDKNDFSYNGQHFDVVFNAIHGTPGENGVLQAYFDLIGVKYTGSGQLAAALTFDKYTCNRFLQQCGMSCAKAISLKKGQQFEPSEITAKLGLPCFVKPNCAGSSFGVSKIKQESELEAAIKKAFEHDDSILIESFLSGTEVTCGVFKYKNEVKALPITEIVSKNDFFDFEAKYKGESEEITPARIDEHIKNEIQAITVKAFNLLNLKGFARIDYIIVSKTPFLLEVNTVPGLTEESLIPKQLKEAGISLQHFFKMMVEEALA